MSATHELAGFLATSSWRSIPPEIRHEGKRALLNWIACALGGCRDEAVERTLRALQPYAGPAAATVIGRPERVDPLLAAVVNAMSSNILDYDDTHLATVIHPSVPVAAAAVALSEVRGATGAQLLHAFILGVEAACRIGTALPDHHAAGWHITGTCGVFGAAAACGRLLQLNAEQMNWALGIAATSSSGMTAMLGSMSKSYNMAHAARDGMAAALLAAQNFTSAEHVFEGEQGYAALYSRSADLAALTRELGQSWALSGNAYKPYPCGIVLHATIDACLELRDRHKLPIDRIARVDAYAHPLALTLAGKPAPRTGLEGKLSIHHVCAVAFLLGKAGVAQFTDASVADPAVTVLRNRVTAHADSARNKMSGRVVVTLDDGCVFEQCIEHARGTLERPLTDAELEAKLAELAPLSGCARTEVAELVWMLDTLRDAAAVPRVLAENH